MATSETEDFELVEGESIALPSANATQAKIRQNAERRVADYFDRNPIGVVLAEIDCRIGAETVRRPDLAVFFGQPIEGPRPEESPRSLRARHRGGSAFSVRKRPKALSKYTARLWNIWLRAAAKFGSSTMKMVKYSSRPMPGFGCFVAKRYWKPPCCRASPSKWPRYSPDSSR